MATQSDPVYQLKITLKRTKPPIWRRVLVSGSITLHDLHEVIQAVMEWDGSHSHGFMPTKPRPNLFELNPGLRLEDLTMADIAAHFNAPDPLDDEDGMRLDQAMADEKGKLVYEYDFGDSWAHLIEMEKVLPPDPDLTLPVCVKGALAAPVDDVGGTWGYYHYLELRTAPKSVRENDERYMIVKDFFPKDFDPNVFDIEAVNKRLARLRNGKKGRRR